MLWMTLGLTKVPITKKEESTQVEEKKWVKTFLTPRGGGGGGGSSRRVKTLGFSSLTYMMPAYQILF